MDSNNIAMQEIAMLQMNEDARKMAQENPKIGVPEIRKATEILRKYKEGKARLEQKIIANEEFWKLRQWNHIDERHKDFTPSTAWLWNCIQGRYADTMDSYPTCNIKPRQMDDIEEAKKLSAILPVVMEQNRYEETYSDIAWYALKQGGCVQGVFWDSNAHNGLGDVKIKKIDFINLFWESGITNIQESANVFNTELVDNDILEQRYPQCVGKLGKKTVTLAKYLYDDNVDVSKKSVVIDWYYHTEYNGKKVLQYCKYVNDVVLFATENEIVPPMAEGVDEMTGIKTETPVSDAMATKGLYDHGMYPFVVMSLYPIEGSICGYGLTDIGKDVQIEIDMLNKAMLDNALDGCTPRYLSRINGGINEDEYLDRTKKIVHYDGSSEGIIPIDTSDLSARYVNFLQMKIDELKFVTNNQDVSNGQAPSGITAGSAISALQEVAGKASRASTKGFYRAYREVIYQVIELIRQFYDVPRTFRIAPDVVGGDEQFVQYDNSGLKAQPMANMLGQQMGLRLPEFDVDVTCEKASPYKKMEMNELALNFYNLGFFNPQMADQALACLEIMDFDHKDLITSKISENQTLQMRLLQFEQMALQLAQQVNPQMADQIAQVIMSEQGGQVAPIGSTDSVELGDTGEHPYNEKARAQADATTQV